MKKSARKPRIAKMFEVKTMSGSFVTAKIAGTESTAKITSVASRKTRATSSGVAKFLPSIRVKNFPPSSAGVTGITRHQPDQQVLFRMDTLFLREDDLQPGED